MIYKGGELKMISDFGILLRATLKMFKIWSPAIVPRLGILLYLKMCKGQARKKREERGVFINIYRGKESV